MPAFRQSRCQTRRTRGAIAIEFALVVALILIPMVVGLYDFGRAFYAYNVLTKSVRSASRYLTTGITTDPARQNSARCIILTGSPTLAGEGCANPVQLPDLDSSSVVVTILTPATTPGINDISTGPTTGAIDLVTVSVSGYPMSKITSLLFPEMVLGPISSTVPNVNF